ncbi:MULTISPECIES: Ger(x)C family spore germination protein [Cytobacillus]|uniref:Ger(x)C family spore germination protein n=1 Tax=Cytobacillus TaxID=2675230 RepID=UPI00203F1921|nr:Ger(x)C family spore germination protein [Cytobacillus firmus]MCM3706445.1 Ger(x)C family spore germination protein [Cytobacillus firmus]
MRKILLIMMIIGLLLGLTGCWGRKDIQGQVYVTAVGIDYTEDEFTVYLQALNFGNIAKQEGASSIKAVPNTIAKAKGKTIQSAISKVERKSAYPLFFGHVETIILSENALKEQLKSVIEYIGQDHFLRYNSNFFGTKQSMKDILNSESFFNYSSLFTVLHNPEELTHSNYILPVQKYNKFISTYYEPVGSYIVPEIMINDTHFTEGKDKKKIAAIMGGFVISNQQYKGYVPKEDLTGVKWTANEAVRIPLTLFDEKASVMITKPRKSVNVLEGTRPAYELIVKGKAQLIQNEESLSIDEIEKELNKKVKRQIRKTLEKGGELQADLLNISEPAYRYYLNTWSLHEIQSFDLSSVEKIKVDIMIEKSVNYKR